VKKNIGPGPGPGSGQKKNIGPGPGGIRTTLLISKLSSLNQERIRAKHNFIEVEIEFGICIWRSVINRDGQLQLRSWRFFTWSWSGVGVDFLIRNGFGVELP
jgi:hypothetical protein